MTGLRRISALVSIAAVAGLVPAQEPGPASKGGYLVVAVALDGLDAESVAFRKVADEVARFHRGRVLPFDGAGFPGLLAALREAEPAFVAFVIRPDRFDVNFHREVALLSARVDDDVFCDFRFGYLTARNGAGLAKLWSRTAALHASGLASKVWIETAVAEKFDPIAIEDFIPAIAKAAGFAGATCFFATKEWKAYSFEKVLEHLKRLETASVVSMSGNGDPHGIWLFDGNRNLDEAKHWPFDPAKVGQDPKGEMPRVKAGHYRKLRLRSPVVWSGTCHSGATRRVYVEGDIVSTFGRSEKVVAYDLEPEDALSLAWLEAGAVALLVPVASNHGMSADLEIDYVIGNGAPLGAAIKSTIDDVMVQSGGRPKIAMKAVGQPAFAAHESPMQSGGMNRVLIGDPALRPFAAAKHPLEVVTVTPITPRGVDVAVTWEKGFHAWAWDMYGDRRDDWRICARVPIDGLMPAGAQTPEVRAEVAVRDGDGAAVPFTLTHAVVERDRGKLVLHLQANAPRAASENRTLHATFKARW